MAKVHQVEETYKGCAITAHLYGYTITGAFAREVDTRKQVFEAVGTKERLAVPGPSCSATTNMQRAKLWIDQQIGAEKGCPLG
jgi:hypothetical protein